jgi:predicted kinase
VDRIALPPRSLLVVGGLPGAGKTTLVRRLAPIAGAVVLDSEPATRRWMRLPLPYRLLRPLAHAEHHLRIALALLLAPGAVVVHETATRRASRRWLLALAALARRPAHLLLLDVPAEAARAGQHARRRTVPSASFARHAGRWRALRAHAATGALPGEPWRRVLLLDRAAADALAAVEVRPAPGRPPLARVAA